jgi:hypothetical protein
VLAALVPLGLLLPACEGDIGESQMYVPGEGLQPPPAEGDADAGTATPDAGLPPFDPFETGGVTIGTLCGPDGPETRLVLTASPASCEAHAQLLGGATPTGDKAIIDAPVVTGPTQFEANGELCLDGDCTSRPFDVEIDAFGPEGAIGRWTATAGGRRASGPLQATVCNYEAFLPGADPDLVPNLAVSEVAMYQGVKIPLARDGAEPRRTVPVIEGRPGLLRVFVEPRAGFAAQAVTAELLWDRGDGSAPERREETITVDRPSRERTRASTFDFPIEGEDVTEGARWAVTLRAQEACAGASGDTSGARFPQSDAADLTPRRVGTYNVVLVPIEIEGRLPDVSEAQLERYRRKIFGMYPVPELNLSVRESVQWQNTLSPNGRGWSELLQALLGLRAEDDPPRNTFYYGIFAPADSIRDFCSRGCVAGLGPLPGPSDEALRGAIGLGFTGDGAANTAAHELGHAAGRPHAPCRVRDADPNYPHPEAALGAWGYDITDGSLKDPDRHRDIMSYCDPEWISDYNYRQLFERISFVNQSQPQVLGVPSAWRMITFTAEGPAWGERVDLRRPPGGAPVKVEFYGDDGRPIAIEAGVEVELDHVDDTIAIIPEPPAGTFLVEVEGHAPVAF